MFNMSKQMNKSNGEAEVFVLPPNLLEKLGINLCNITQNPQQLHEPKKRKKNKKSFKNESYSNHAGIIKSVSKARQKNEEESSILETADLMKKSVFLSPTFIPMVVNAIPGEVEIGNSNAEIVSNDNNYSKVIHDENAELGKLPCTVSNLKQQATSKKSDPTMICNGNGLISKRKTKENDFSSDIHVNYFNSDVAKSDQSNGNFVINDMQVSRTSLNLNNNVESTSPKHKQDDSQTSNILCYSYANESHEISGNFEQDISLAMNFNKLKNDTSDHVRDTVLSNEKYFINNKSTLELDEALIIPLAMTAASASNFNLSDINRDVEDINIDIFQSLHEQESNELVIASREHSQKHDICKSIEGNVNDVNIDIFKYTECDECSDMELENMLHETEILVPTTSSAEKIKSGHNEVINIINKGANHTNVLQYVCDENELCNSIEGNKILISILPELMDTSNLDIFCEHNISNEIKIDNTNKNEKIMSPISITSQSVQHIQSNVINMETINYAECHETSNTSDVELDNMLKESETLITLPFPSGSIKNTINNRSNVSDNDKRTSPNDYEGEVRFLSEIKNPDEKENDMIDQILHDKIVLDHNATTKTDEPLEDTDSSKQIEVNDKKRKAEKNVHDRNTQSSLQGTKLDSHKTNLNIELNDISTIKNVEENIIYRKSVNVTKSLEQNIHRHKKYCFINESKEQIVSTDNRNQTKQTIENNNARFVAEVNRIYEVNKLQKPEFAKSCTDNLDDTSSMHKKTKTSRLQDRAILHNQHDLSYQLNSVTQDTSQNDHLDNTIKDKVHEIAEYLKQVIQNKNKRRLNGKRGVKILKPKTENFMKSKIFIQGVEKPGGSKELEICFDKIKLQKTYERKANQVTSHLTPIIGAALLKDVTRPEENYIEINTCVNQTTIAKQKEFCLCGDFGKFAYYDNYDNLYEHIHFASKKSVNCSAETVFEIYNNDESIENSTEEKECTLEKNNGSECEDWHICWQTFEYLGNKFVSPEMLSSKQNEWIENTVVKTELDSPKIRRKLETVDFIELGTNETQDKHINDENVVSSQIIETSLTEVIVEVNCEITSTLSRHPMKPVSNVDVESKQKLNSTEHQSPEIVDESCVSFANVDVESEQKEDSTEHQSSEIVDEPFISFANVDVESEQKEDSTEHQSSEIVDVSVVSFANVDVESKQKEEIIEHQPSEIVDVSFVSFANVDVESKQKEDIIEHQPSEIVDESFVSLANIDVESKQKEDIIEHQPSEIVDVSFVCFANVDVESKQKEDSTEHQSSEIVNKSFVSFANVDVESKQKEDIIEHQPSEIVDVSFVSFANVDVESKQKEDIIEHQPSEIVDESFVSLANIDVESKQKEDIIEHQPSEIVDVSFVCFANVDVESKQKEDSTEHQSSEIVNESFVSFANVDVESKQKEDIIEHQPSEIVDVSFVSFANVDVEGKQKGYIMEHQPSEIVNVSFVSFANVDVEGKQKEDIIEHQPSEILDESFSIHENMKNQVIDSSTNNVENVQKSRDHLKRRKRKIKEHYEEPSSKKSDKCGVCQQVFAHSEWENHISTVHCYIAWKDGESFNSDNSLLVKKIEKKLKRDSSLACGSCAFKTDSLEKFQSHVKKCVTQEVSPRKTNKRKEPKEVASSSKSGRSKCGVCHLEVDDVNWLEHISEQHNYLAWKDGEPPLNTSDENEVKTHLLNYVKMYGQLICTKCGLVRKYTLKSIKSYLSHIKKCQNIKANVTRGSVINTDQSTAESDPPSSAAAYKCAVCLEEVDASMWFDHIGQEHNYRAWKDGDEAPNLEDKDVLWEHLNEISKECGGLICSKCGLVRRYVKSFLQHIGSCTGREEVDVSNSDIKKEANELNTIESSNASTEIDASNSTSSPETSMEASEKTSCGVCNEAVEESAWIDHIGKEHNYLAWRDEETPLDTNNREEVWQHLHNIVGTAGQLVCAKCGLIRKYPKLFLKHISDCRGPDTSVVDDSMNESSNYSVISHLDRSLKGLNAGVKEVTCGVCQAVVRRNAWIGHIQTAHNYVAWIAGDTPLDLNNEEMIRDHLQQIVDEVGTLSCPNCGTSRKYAMKFLQHMKQCTDEKNTEKTKDCSSTTSKNIPPFELVQCGVCKQSVQINQWLNHIRTTHNYIAWKQGQWPARNPAQAKKRLQSLIDRIGGLACLKCGHKSNDVDLYLEHGSSCKEILDNETEDDEVTKLAREGLYRCQLCSDNIKYGEWRDHSLGKHYIVSWVIGDEPIDLFNQNEIAKIMKEYQQYGEFVCKVCGLTRSSGLGFFAHIISCGLKEEESDRFKMFCQVCNSKVPGIYKSQHLAAHTQTELAKQRKAAALEDKERERQRKLEELTPASGRRRAAEKARIVIEETDNQFKHVCQSCAFATDSKVDMAEHKCAKKRKLSDDLDLSMEQDESSEDEAFPEIEEECDDEEEDLKSDTKRKSDNSSSRITRIPFVVSNVQDYVANNLKDYTNTYLTTATLFPEWTKCCCEAVLGDEMRQYMPPLEESCQVHSNGNWRTYKRWEAVVVRQNTTIFTGASIQRIKWLPAPLGSEPAANVLAVACHSGVDCPQYLVDELPEHDALVQLWDFGDFKSVPKLVFGLALQHGTVWAMDWCPSGAREAPPNDSETGFVRMGLLAVACSNGMAYIYAVPYPSSVVLSDSIIHKLEPVAQLKFTMKSDRKLYQATSICWSQQKGHGTVIVGYADGSTAYYDLNTESPFLKSQEKNVTTFYPFYDERTHNGSVIDMDSFPMARASSVAGAVSSASPTGSALCSRGGSSRCARVRSHLASSTVNFLPAWPSALLAGEDIVTNLAPAELEYWGMGRRAGFLQSSCGCPHCALVATFMAPFLRLMRAHHSRSDIKKQVVAWIGTKQLAKKRKHNEDKSAVKMEEALTYEEAITKYGIQFKLLDKVTNKDDLKKAMFQYKEVNPECFPIAEVPSMAFCPSAKHHKRLAIATHAGLIFVINV